MEEEREYYSSSMGFPFSAVAGDNCSDVDFSFNSTASTSSSSFATTSNYSSSSARSSLSLPSFSSSTSLINPLPHSRSNSAAHWSAVRAAASLSRDGALHLSHLSLIRHVGSGHLARVFHCRLKGSRSYDFALKVVDLDQSARALSHVRTEARVLASLDHPFLPTLFARMDASHYACFLIDYCPGGDLHSLLVRHPGHRLPLAAVRFYAAEVLLALEYLHALGFVYRDLKPENVLIRSDGHIMLSDFDLCFSSDPNPSLRRRTVLRHRSRGCWSSISSSRDDDGDNHGDEELEVVAEPEGAYSKECVGTHEYLAPEIVSGNGHGKGVDWWAFGVFVYELMYGRTPFKGRSKEETLKNVMTTDLRFPDQGDAAAADLIRRLLVRDASGRMGCSRGAAEIKKHPFFEGVRWQLMRCQRPPVAVGPDGAVVVKVGRKGSSGWRCWLGRIAGKLCHRSSSKKGIKVYSSSASSVNNGMKSKKRLSRQKAMKL